MTKVAVVSDIHGNLPALEAVERDAIDNSCTQFFNLGDLLSGPLWPAETADWLMARGWPTIAGNHERQVLTLPSERTGASDAFARAALDDAHRAWLASLPGTLTIGGMCLVHGTPRSDLEHFLETVEPSGLRAATEREVAARLGSVEARLTLCGHSHLPGEATVSDGRKVANPGSVGLQAFEDDHPFPYRVKLCDPRARYAIVADGDVIFRAVEYDHASAAAKAEREGFDAWAKWLASGEV